MSVQTMKGKILVLLPTLIAALVVVNGVAISGTSYSWEKTFDVTQPAVECDIEISDCTYVGCPVKIWVKLKLAGDCGLLWPPGKHEGCGNGDEGCGCKCACWGEDDWDDAYRCQVNGTYAVDLYWWNVTNEDWLHVMALQEETNVTLTCWKHVATYVFVPELEGQYKVVVTFATATETVTFSSED